MQNELQTKLENNLAELNAKWWAPKGQPLARVYLNPPQFKGTKLEKQIRLWLSFADPETLAGAQLNCRVDCEQHPNWIRDQQERWKNHFAGVLEAVEILREEAGLDEAQEAEAVAQKQEIKTVINEAVKEVVAEDKAAAKMEREIIRAGASTLEEIASQHGNVDIREGVAENFAHVAFSAAFKWSARTKTDENKWLNRAKKAANCLPALVGFRDKKQGRPGHTFIASVPVLDGVVCLKKDEAAIRSAVAEIEAQAERAFNDSPDAASQIKAEMEKSLAHGEFVGVFSQSQAGFALMQPGESRVSAKGIRWTCRVSGSKWYVAIGEKVQGVTA